VEKHSEIQKMLLSPLHSSDLKNSKVYNLEFLNKPLLSFRMIQSFGWLEAFVT